MKKLRIAQIAPLWYRIPPEKYGGIELVVSNLTEELVKRGHKVTLFASGDSKTSAKLFSVYPRHLRKDSIDWTDQRYTLLNLSEVFKRQDEFDIIHSHVDLYDLFFTHFAKKPFVSTIHNRLVVDKTKKGNLLKCKKSARISIYHNFRCQNIVTISNAQKKLSDVKMNFIGTVYNGIDIDKFKYNSYGSDYFIWIGRINKDKGIETAIKVIKKLNMKLIIAARVESKSEKFFFEGKIKPYLSEKIKFIGEITARQKSNFFGKAKALLYPIKWDEPFGLVMTEAMVCGTPVIAFDRGSVSEVVKNNKTGFVVPRLDKREEINISGLAEAIRKIDQIKRKECRQWVKDNFTIEKMTDGYEEIYAKLIKNKNKIKA